MVIKFSSHPAPMPIDTGASELELLAERVRKLEATVAMLVATRNQADGNVTTNVTKPKRDRAAYMRERRRTLRKSIG